MTTQAWEILRKVVEEQLSVFIDHNNETGTWQYAVCPRDDPSFWVDGFPTEREALAFIEKYGLWHKEKND